VTRCGCLKSCCSKRRSAPWWTTTPAFDLVPRRRRPGCSRRGRGHQGFGQPDITAVRSIHICAQMWWHCTAALFRSTAQQLQTLPGIGRSTAAAIASVLASGWRFWTVT
jgi:hypothetical protein